MIHVTICTFYQKAKKMGKMRIELTPFDPQSNALPLHHLPFDIYILKNVLLMII